MVRPAGGRPIDSQVRRPMIIVCPIVRRLNRCKSLDSRHGSWPSRPITPFSDTATMMETRMRNTARNGAKAQRRPLQRGLTGQSPKLVRLESLSYLLNRNRRGNVWVGVVIFKLKMFVFEV